MPRQYCRYHPLEPAMWYNPGNHASYCERCVDSSETRGGVGQAKCYVNGAGLTYLGSAHTAQPFWDRLPAMFKYPMQKNSLIMTGLIIAMLFGVVSVGLTFLPVLIAGGLVLLGWTTRYAFLILEHSAEGRFDAPNLSEAFSGSGLSLLVQQIVVQVIFGVLAGLISILGSSLLDTLVSAVLLLIWPASMILLATERSIRVAASPSAIWHLISSIGWAYLLLYAFLMLLFGVQAALFGIFAEEIPLHWFLPLFLGLMLYFMMACFHLMGYVVFQYQAEIGFVAEDQLAREKRRLRLEPVDAMSELLVKDGQYQRAVEILIRHLKQRPDSIRHHEKLSKLLLAMGDSDEGLAHGQHFMEIVHRMGDDARLYFLFSRYQELDAGFKPQQPELCLALAQQFFQRGKYEQVCQLLANLHKTAPNFAGIPDAYLLIAQALLDGFNDHYKAGQYLKFVTMKYPDFNRQDQVKSLLADCARSK